MTPLSESVNYSIVRTTRASRTGVAAAIVGVAVLASVPAWADASFMRLAIEFACFLVIAQMWNLLAGYGGLVSIGQQAYIGLGGYALFVLADQAGINPFLCVPLAALIAALVAIPTSKIVFRLQGGYFAIGTWVIAEVFRLLFANTSALGGGSGTSLIALRNISRATREAVTYWIALGIAVASVALVYALLRSRFGLALTAIRDNERAAESQGVNVERTKFLVYIASAFGCGIAGALYYLANVRISPDAAFNVNWTAFVIFIVVIGGIGTIEGPILGTVLFVALRELFSEYGSGYLIALGVTAIVVMMRFPRGLWGVIENRFDLRFFPVRRRLETQGHRRER